MEDTIKPLWVKKLIRTLDWNGNYRYNSTYCFLSHDKGSGVWAAFAVADFGGLPRDCILLNDEELLLVDNYRRNANILPTPFKRVENNEKSKATSEINFN